MGIYYSVSLIRINTVIEIKQKIRQKFKLPMAMMLLSENQKPKSNFLLVTDHTKTKGSDQI